MYRKLHFFYERPAHPYQMVTIRGHPVVVQPIMQPGVLLITPPPAPKRRSCGCACGCACKCPGCPHRQKSKDNPDLKPDLIPYLKPYLKPCALVEYASQK